MLKRGGGESLAQKSMCAQLSRPATQLGLSAQSGTGPFPLTRGPSVGSRFESLKNDSTLEKLSRDELYMLVHCFI
jgi:hypothetical protein